MNSKPILFLVVGLALIATNPSQGDYADWVQEQSMKSENDPLIKAMISAIGKPFIDASSIRRNFYLFSTVETRLDENHEIFSMGFLKNFVSVFPNKAKQNGAAEVPGVHATIVSNHREALPVVPPKRAFRL